MGKVMNFISGNFDQDDVQNQVALLRNTQTKEIQNMNKLVSFSDTTTTKFYYVMILVDINTNIVKRTQIFPNQKFRATPLFINVFKKSEKNHTNFGSISLS